MAIDSQLEAIYKYEIEQNVKTFLTFFRDSYDLCCYSTLVNRSLDFSMKKKKKKINIFNFRSKEIAFKLFPSSMSFPSNQVKSNQFVCSISSSSPFFE